MNKVMRILSVIIPALLAACFASSAWAVAVSASKSTVVASPTTVVADGVSLSTITVTLKSKSGAVIKNVVVTLTAGSGSSIITIVNATTNNLGQAFFTVKDSVAQSVVYTAKVGGVTITQKATVKFVLKAPTVAKNFSPATIAANGTSTLTITLTNPNTTNITGAAFTDTFPASLVTSGTASTTCGGAATAGGGSLTLTGGTIPASGSCTVTVAVTSATAGSYANTIAIGAVTSTNALANTAASNTATLVVTAISALNSTVVASPTTVLANGVATATITVTLKDGAGGVVSGKTVTLAQSGISSNISAASGLSDINGVVTFTVKDAVVGTVGTTTFTATSGGVQITQTAAVTYVLVPILKSFATSPIAARGTSTLSVTLTNATGASVSGAGFSDTYPAGLVNAGNPSTSGSCGAGVLSGASGNSILGITNATIAANSACTVSVSVTAATAGTYSNTATNTAGSTSTAILVVQAISAANSTVSENPVSLASVLADGSSLSTITVTLKDGAAIPNTVAGITVTLSASAGGSIITTVSGVTNASGQATFTVTDITPEGPITYSAKDTTDLPNIAIPTTVSATFTRITAPTVTKSFNPTTIADNGMTTLTITLANSNTGGSINGVAFTDTYPTGLSNISALVSSNTCGGTATADTAIDSLALSGGTIPASGSCSVSVQVTANNATCPPCTIVNSTSAVTSTNANSGLAASATLTDIGVDPILSTVVAVPTAVPADNSTLSIITVTLKDGAGNLVPDTIVSLAASSGSSTITATCTGPCTTAGMTDVNGQATFTVRDGVVESVTYTATDTTDVPNIVIAQQATVTFGTALGGVYPFNAFDWNTPAGTTTGGYIKTKISGAAFPLDLVALTSVPAVYTGFTGTVKVELVDSSSGTCATYSTIQLLPNQTFVAGDNGRHNIVSITEPNAWKNVRVRISYPVVSPTSVSCSNDNFAIRPNSFAILVQDLNRTTAGTTNTLNTTTVAGTPVHNAGQPFTVQATALNAAAVTTTNYTGTPTIVTSLCTNVGAITDCGATLGAFSIGTWSATVAGVVNTTTATYSEVGAFTLQLQDTGFASVDSGDLTSADCAGLYVCSSVVVGRFVPDHFSLSAASITNRADLACPTCTFTYMGEQMNALFTLTAQAAGGTTTQNYAGVLAKLVPTAAGNPLVFGAVNSTATPTYLTARLDTSLAATGGFVAGVANVTSPLAITRGATADGPYALLDIGIAPQDGDGVIMATYDLDTDAIVGNDHTKVVRTEVRYGRIKVSNAYGSELLPLTLTATAQYYTATGWANSITDNVTNLALAANYNVVKNGTTTGTTAASKSPASGLSAGQLTITLAIPTGGAGTATISSTAPSYLPVTSGTATFGVYKSNNSFIYRRENY